MSTSPTPAQQRWLEHIRAAEERGLTLKAYAGEQGLSVSQLYTAKGKLKRARLLDEAPPTFVAVRVPGQGAAAPVLTVRLPNGIALEVPEGTSGASLRTVLDALGMQP